MTLDSIAEIRLGMPFKSAIQDVGEEQGSCYLIQTKDIEPNGILNLESLTPVMPEGNTEKYYLYPNDIVLRLRGPMFSAGIIDDIKGKPIITSNQIAVIRCNENFIVPHYLHWYINSTSGSQYIRSISEGSSISKISLKMLSKINIILPSITEQIKISKINKNWNKQKVIYNALMKNGDVLFNGICESIINERK
ncbi:restriction endonuclease subunit S [Providencia manganoxydans]|uniref:restriction endonuclease subunit S n=1 Tax=Providencia manganoxydans TaxID=2923283 RepID=UPI0029C05505|nr:restriction endonuclease subunit S [Providencia manganoxydans]MDX4945922.1 restriction endonuclease subunit S [Providencia manganoxydans]